MTLPPWFGPVLGAVVAAVLAYLAGRRTRRDAWLFEARQRVLRELIERRKNPWEPENERALNSIPAYFANAPAVIKAYQTLADRKADWDGEQRQLYYAVIVEIARVVGLKHITTKVLDRGVFTYTRPTAPSCLPPSTR
jgi:hypothetical protein